jgi:23S rRNA (guanosine2251-2'-O)-methyltransferase
MVGPPRRATLPRSRADRPAAEPALETVWGLHPVTEIVQARPGQVERVFAVSDRHGPLGRVLRQAREAGIPVTYLTRELFERRVPARGSQGIAAEVAARPYADPDTLCAAAAAKDAGCLVALDGVTDSRNVGAVLRTCAAAGIDGMLLSSEGTAGLGPAALKASAGTAERLPVAREARLSRRLEALAGMGFAVVGLGPREETPWDAVDLTGRLVLVAGGEERGLRPGLARVCTRRVAIPLAPGVESLNVGIALGVLLFEAVRQRRRFASRP